MLKSLLTSTLLSCLALSSISLPVQSTTPPMPMIDSSFNSTDSKAIAQQVLKDAIAQENLSRTARVQRIERVGREIWMYNPVPYWKITIKDQRQTLVYLATQDGRFRALVRRNGQPTQPTGQPATAVAPPDMTSAALKQARAIWGYTMNNQTQITSQEKVSWTSGCETAPLNPACSPMVFNGWKITIASQDARLVFRGRIAQDLQLIERTSDLERRLPALVRNKARELAAQQFQLSPTTIAINHIEMQTYSDSCLGLGGIAETCARQVVKGYRISVAGKFNQRQIYRISSDAKIWRTES